MRDLAAAAALAALLLAGCSSSDSASPAADPPSSTPTAATATPQPRPVAPRNGACYRLGFDDALAPTADDDAVRCRRPHTSQTFRVGRIDRGIEVDSSRAQRQARETCTSQLGPFLGADREALRLSLLGTVWFTPTLEEGDAGGRWFRCDVIATAGADRLLTLPRDLKAARAGFALCATSEPGRQDSRRVPCSQQHGWRALATVDLPGTGYPSADQAADAMDDTCRARAREDADDPLDFTWSEERPARAQWTGGQRYGICWVPD